LAKWERSEVAGGEEDGWKMASDSVRAAATGREEVGEVDRRRSKVRGGDLDLCFDAAAGGTGRLAGCRAIARSSRRRVASAAAWEVRGSSAPRSSKSKSSGLAVRAGGRNAEDRVLGLGGSTANGSKSAREMPDMVVGSASWHLAFCVSQAMFASLQVALVYRLKRYEYTLKLLEESQGNPAPECKSTKLEQ
jgi:hypothetical protein